MSEELMFPLLILLVLAFILLVPALLYAGLRKIADPIPAWLPLLPAVLVLLVMGALIQLDAFGSGASMAGTFVMFSLLLLLTSLAVITPYCWFGKKTGIDRPWLVFSLLSFVGVAMMFWSTMGESREGGPLPQFFLILPLTGWIFDGIATVLNIPEIVYSAALPVHTLLLAAGLYLEVLIISAMFSILLVGLNPAKNE